MTDTGPGMTDAGPGMTDAGPGMTGTGPSVVLSVWEFVRKNGPMHFKRDISKVVSMDHNKYQYSRV